MLMLKMSWFQFVYSYQFVIRIVVKNPSRGNIRIILLSEKLSNRKLHPVLEHHFNAPANGRDKVGVW